MCRYETGWTKSILASSSTTRWMFCCAPLVTVIKKPSNPTIYLRLQLMNPQLLPVDMQFRELVAKKRYTMVIFIVKPGENGLAGCTQSNQPESTVVSSDQIALTNMCFLPTIYLKSAKDPPCPPAPPPHPPRPPAIVSASKRVGLC